MAYPTFVNVSNVAGHSATTGTLSVTPGAHVANDILVLFVETNGGAATPSLSTANGFASFGTVQSTGTGTAGTKLTMFWARATSSAMAAPILAASTDHLYAVMVTFRGCITTGNPFVTPVGGVKATASLSATLTGVTTTEDESLIVLAITKDLDSATAFVTSMTNANLASITERFDVGTASGTGGGIGVYTAQKATAGATGNTTASVTNSINAFQTFALKPLPTAITQSSFRFYEDGTESGSAAIAAQDTNISRDVSSGDSNLALRLRLQESNSTAGLATDDYQLQYSLNSGSFANTGSGAVLNYASTNLTDGGATTNRLGAGTGSFVAGKVSEDGLVDDHQITASNYTEHLYSVTIDSDSVVNNDTLDFKVLRNGQDITLVDSYPVGNVDVMDSLANGSECALGFSQSFTGNGSPLKSVVFYLGKLGAPTGNAVAKVYAHSGTYGTSSVPTGAALATSDNLDVSTLSTSPALTTINFSGVNNITLTSGTMYVVSLEYSGGDNSNKVLIGADSTSPTHSGNYAYFVSFWDPYSPWDFIFYVYSSIIPRVTIIESVGPPPVPLTVQEMTASVSLDTVALTQANALVVSEPRSSSLLDAVSLTQANTLAVNDATSAITLDNAVLSQGYTLTVQEMTSSVALDSAVLTQANTLVRQEATSFTSVDNVALTQANILAVADLTSSSMVDNTVLSQLTTLVVQDLMSTSNVDGVTVTHAYSLTVNDLLSTTSLDLVTISAAYTLSANDSTSSIALDNITLSQANSIVSHDLDSSTTIENVVLSQSTTLTVGDAISTVSLDAVSVTQANTLSVNDSTSTTTVDNISLIQANTLVNQDASSSTSIDNVALSQALILSVQDSTSSTSLDSASLTQENTLAVNDSISQTTIEGVSLTQANTLSTQDLTSATSIDSVELVSGMPLSISDATSSTTLDNVSLTQQYNLAVNNLSSSTSLDNLALIQSFIIVAQDATSSTTIDSPITTSGTVLTVNDALSTAYLDDVTVAQHTELILADLFSSTTLDGVVLGGIPYNGKRIIMLTNGTMALKITDDLYLPL